MAVALTIAACASNGADSGDTNVTKPIEQVVAARTPELMRIPGVQGVGQALCDDVPCIRVYIVNDSVRSRLPAQLDGYTVSAVVTGPITTTRD